VIEMQKIDKELGVDLEKVWRLEFNIKGKRYVFYKGR